MLTQLTQLSFLKHYLSDCEQLLGGYMTTVESQSVWITRAPQLAVRRSPRRNVRSPPQRVAAATTEDKRLKPSGRHPHTKRFPEDDVWAEKTRKINPSLIFGTRPVIGHQLTNILCVRLFWLKNRSSGKGGSWTSKLDEHMFKKSLFTMKNRS